MQTCRKVLVSIVLAGSALVLSAPQSMALTRTVSPTSPHIVARPNNLMVNTSTTLKGTGFAPHAKITIEECGQKGWIVPQNPCDTDNAITVHTDGSGRFKGSLKAELCPRTQPGPGPVTQETCYLGQPKPEGIDTIQLVGAAKIIVTYP